MAKRARTVDTERKQLIAEGVKAGLTKAEAIAQADKILGERDFLDEDGNPNLDTTNQV